jgi:hypothetical protein
MIGIINRAQMYEVVMLAVFAGLTVLFATQIVPLLAD